MLTHTCRNVDFLPRLRLRTCLLRHTCTHYTVYAPVTLAIPGYRVVDYAHGYRFRYTYLLPAPTFRTHYARYRYASALRTAARRFVLTLPPPVVVLPHLGSTTPAAHTTPLHTTPLRLHPYTTPFTYCLRSTGFATLHLGLPVYRLFTHAHCTFGSPPTHARYCYYPLHYPHLLHYSVTLHWNSHGYVTAAFCCDFTRCLTLPTPP